MFDMAIADDSDDIEDKIVGTSDDCAVVGTKKGPSRKVRLIRR